MFFTVGIGYSHGRTQSPDNVLFRNVSFDCKLGIVRSGNSRTLFRECKAFVYLGYAELGYRYRQQSAVKRDISLFADVFGVIHVHDGSAVDRDGNRAFVSDDLYIERTVYAPADYVRIERTHFSAAVPQKHAPFRFDSDCKPFAVLALSYVRIFSENSEARIAPCARV